MVAVCHLLAENAYAVVLRVIKGMSVSTHRGFVSVLFWVFFFAFFSSCVVVLFL